MHDTILDTSPDGEWRETVGGPAPVPTAPPPSEDESFISRLRASAGRQGLDRLKIKVFRRVKGSADLEFCADYSPSEFEAGDLEALRDAWGPGSYELRVIGPRGIAMRETVTLARRELVPGPAPAAPQLDALAGLIGQLARGQEAIAAALAARPDPGAQLRETLALMASMREAMGLNQAPAPATDPTAMLSSIVGAVRQLREVSSELNPPPPAADASDPMTLLPSVLGLVQTAMEKQGQPAALPAPVEPVTSNPSPPVPQPSEDPDEPMQALIIRAMLPRLTAMARANRPPAEAAALILDYAPDELLAAVEAPDWWETLTAIAFELREYRGWCEAVRAEVIKGMEPGADSAP